MWGGGRWETVGHGETKRFVCQQDLICFSPKQLPSGAAVNVNKPPIPLVDKLPVCRALRLFLVRSTMWRWLSRSRKAPPPSDRRSRGSFFGSAAQILNDKPKSVLERRQAGNTRSGWWLATGYGSLCALGKSRTDRRTRRGSVDVREQFRVRESVCLDQVRPVHLDEAPLFLSLFPPNPPTRWYRFFP
jgi:hypothetical protein